MGGDKTYKSIDELWSAEVQGPDGRSKWYAGATTYWQGQEASINGVLGGYPETHEPDIRESKRFLDLIRKSDSPPGFGSALDCGAGIGRVTSSLLAQCLEHVDLVEPNKRLLDTAQSELSSNSHVDRFINTSLQTCVPEPGKYDMIWAQWVLLYLPEDDLIQFLERCVKGLRENGMIFVKENVVLEGKCIVDKEDNSVSRTDAQYREVFQKAGLEVIHALQQTCWPDDLVPVMMYALRPTRKGAEGAVRKEAVKKKPAARSPETKKVLQKKRPGK